MELCKYFKFTCEALKILLRQTLQICWLSLIDLGRGNMLTMSISYSENGDKDFFNNL